MKQLLIIFLFISCFLFSTEIDSLKKVVINVKDDSLKAITYLQIAEYYKSKNNTSKQKNALIQAIKLSEKNKYNKILVEAYSNYGTFLRSQNDYDESISVFSKALNVLDEDTSLTAAKIINNIGTNYRLKGEYQKAVSYTLKALNIFEAKNDLYLEASAYNNLAIISFYQKNINKSLEYFEKALEIYKQLDDKVKIANLKNNIAVIYKNLNEYNKALSYYLSSLETWEELNDAFGLAVTNQNIGNVYIKLYNLPKAKLYLNKALKYREIVGDKKGLIETYVSLAGFYNANKQINQSIAYTEKALKLSKEIGLSESIKECYNLLAENYYKTGQYKKAYENFVYYTHIKDSLLNENNLNTIAELEVKYQNDKKEKQIQLLKTEKEKQSAIIERDQAELERQKFRNMTIVVGLIIVLIFLFIVFQMYRQRGKANLLLTKQKQLIEEKNKEITDSIQYAKRIQTAILPRIEKWKELLPDSFVYYLPKDIVAGDFYWMETGVETLETTVYFAAADCTGHGVPGAMVSVVCSNALSKAVVEEKITEPGKILDRTRELVIERFAKSSEDVKDGMDISLCAIDFKTMTLQWAGANNPLWIVRNVELEMLNDKSKKEYSTFNTQHLKLIEAKPDKQPIGKVENPQPFTTHTIELQKGDTIYIFTDGFADQFGGEKGKKFKYKPFKELLHSIQDKSMDEQKQIIEETFIKWKGDLEQVDDVCVIGVKV